MIVVTCVDMKYKSHYYTVPTLYILWLCIICWEINLNLNRHSHGSFIIVHFGLRCQQFVKVFHRIWLNVLLYKYWQQMEEKLILVNTIPDTKIQLCYEWTLPCFARSQHVLCNQSWVPLVFFSTRLCLRLIVFGSTRGVGSRSHANVCAEIVEIKWELNLWNMIILPRQMRAMDCQLLIR